ncbi:MAG TPA: hypothetical protein VNA25_30495 [Phycisphaerae bacterium]|nr:hypothetical protein [Phycisphaerae bacterium]
MSIRWDEAKWREMQARLRRLTRSYPTAAQKAAGQIGKQVIWDSINVPPTVPIDTGNLRSSGTFEVFARPSGATLTVGFNTPYAAHVHQVPMTFREPGSGNYFLSSKLQRFRQQYVSSWGRKIAQIQGTA